MTATFAPLIVLSVPQIIARWDLNADEFDQLMQLLKGKQRKLTTGKPAYFLSDVEATLQLVRRGESC